MTTFAERAQALGAGALLAPERRTDPLTNKGAFDIADAILHNKLSLTEPGLIRGYASAPMNPTAVNYIEVPWPSRTNWLKNPSFETDVAEWFAEGTYLTEKSTLTRTLAEHRDGVASAKIEKGATAFQGILTRSGDGVVPSGIDIVASAYIKAPAGEPMLIAMVDTGGAQAIWTEVVATGAWQRIQCTLKTTAARNWQVVIRHDAAKAITFYVDDVVLEQGTVPTSYFPRADQIASAEAVKVTNGFDVGPFARDRTTTFVGVARQTSGTNPQVVMGDFTGGGFYNIVGQINGGVWTVFPGGLGPASWALPTSAAAGKTFFWALVFNDAANTAQLFINGVALSAPVGVGAATWLPNGTNLMIGRYGGGQVFNGEQLPVAVFAKALTAEQIQSLYETLVLEGPPPAPIVAMRADPQSGRLAFYLRRPDGTEKRVAGDEPQAEDVGRNFTFGTSIPGGHGAANLDLTRDPRIDYGDFGIYDEFVARGPGNECAHQGYNIEVPGSDDEQVSIVAAGWQAYLKDNPTFQEIYVDRDLGRWGAVPAPRKVITAGASQHTTDVQHLADPSTGLPVLEFKLDGAWIAPWIPVCEAWYDGGPSARIRQIHFGYKAVAPVSGDLNFALAAYTGADANISVGLETTGDVFTATAEGTVVFSPTARNRYGLFIFYYPFTPAGGDGAAFPMHVRNVLVVGNHQVPLSQNNYLGGVLCSDVVANIVSRAAPLLTFTTGSEGSIRPSTYPIPHLIYPEPVTAEEAILQASKYDVPDWGVYGKEFFWRPPGEGRVWVARQGDPGCSLKNAGRQAEDVYNGVVVQYTDPSGKTFMIGPPGTAGCDAFSESLRDANPLNPLNERGRTRLGKLTVGAVTTQTGAVQLGARWLQEELAVSDRGSAVVTGFVRDSVGVIEPVWKVRAGDRIRFDDADGRERRIIETNYAHEERQNSLTLDSMPHRIESLMERMQVELVAVGAGS